MSTYPSWAGHLYLLFKELAMLLNQMQIFQGPVQEAASLEQQNIALQWYVYHEKYLMTKNIKYQSCNSTISIVARSDLQRENRRPAAVEQDGYVNNLLMIINSVQVPAARWVEHIPEKIKRFWGQTIESQTHLDSLY